MTAAGGYASGFIEICVIVIKFVGRGGLAVTMVTQYDIDRVKNIESNISKLFFISATMVTIRLY
jgi:hypothetical protein